MRQCVLKSKNSRMTTWLDDRKDLKEGVWVTLSTSEDQERRWQVISMGEKMNGIGIVGAHDSKIIHQKDFIRDGKGGFRNVK